MCIRIRLINLPEMYHLHSRSSPILKISNRFRCQDCSAHASCLHHFQNFHRLPKHICFYLVPKGAIGSTSTKTEFSARKTIRYIGFNDFPKAIGNSFKGRSSQMGWGMLKIQTRQDAAGLRIMNNGFFT